MKSLKKIAKILDWNFKKGFPQIQERTNEELEFVENWINKWYIDQDKKPPRELLTKLNEWNAINLQIRELQIQVDSINKEMDYQNPLNPKNMITNPKLQVVLKELADKYDLSDSLTKELVEITKGYMNEKGIEYKPKKRFGRHKKGFRIKIKRIGKPDRKAKSKDKHSME